MIRKTFLSAFPLVLLLAGCNPEQRSSTATAPQRIVTVNGTATEIVAALGLVDRIVGVDVTSTYPEPVTKLPKVGHDRNVKAEGVISLQPDLVIGAENQLDATVVGQLRTAGERVVLFPWQLSVEGAKSNIQRIADSLAVSDRAAALIATIDEDIKGLQPLAVAPKVLFIYARGAGSLMVAGNGTPMHRMIELAGGRNAMSGFDQFKPLTPEALVAADPDAILLFTSGLDGLQGADGLLAVPGMAQTTAGRNKAFITMEGGLLSNFGPRLGKALVELNTRFRSLTPAP